MDTHEQSRAGRRARGGCWARLLAGLAAAALIGLALAACGGGNDEAGTTESETSAPAAQTEVAVTTGAGSSSSETGDDPLAQAKAEVESLLTPATDIGVSEPLAERPEGKLLVHVRCAAPICVEASKSFKAAAEALGMRFQAIDAGATPESIAKAFDQTVALKPDAVIEGAIPPELFSEQLDQLVAQGTKVFLFATPEPVPEGVSALMYPPAEFDKVGRQMARFVYADSEGNPGPILYVEAPEFAALKVSAEGFQDELAKLCPDCSVEVVNVQATDIGTKVPGRVVSYLQANPDTTYVISQFGDLEVGVPQALEAAGITGKKLITTQGSPVNMQYVKDGQEYADLINYLDVLNWQTVDVIARVLAGQDFEIPPVPVQWVMQENLDFDPAKPPPFGIDYQAAFKELWGSE